ncbi:MAG: hypothetical protein IJ661_12495 [Lachnospiraceae bacterium]|nr:hypothetical protein [Lachnospiraceae bacterium]
MTNREKYKKTFDSLVSSEYIALEVDEMKKKHENKRGRNNVAAAALLIAVLVGTGGMAYAASKYYGLLDFTKQRTEQIPEDAVELIDTEIVPEKVDETENSIMDCSVKEALIDSGTIRIVYEVSALEQGKYLFIPEDAVPSDNMSDWSDIKGVTAREYADANGLEIVNIGGGITNMDELGIAGESLIFKSAGDDVMDIYVKAGKSNSSKSLEVVCTATARISDQEDAIVYTDGSSEGDDSINDGIKDSDYAGDGDGSVEEGEMKAAMAEVMRKNITFTLQDMSSVKTSDYSVVSKDMEDDAYNIEDAAVLQTELGTYIDVHFNSTLENDDMFISFHILDEKGNDIDDANNICGSGIEFNDDGSMQERIMFNRMDMGERFFIEVYNYEEERVLGTFEMERKNKL